MIELHSSKMPGSTTRTLNGSNSTPPSLKKSSSSSKNQTSIAGFFRKKDQEAASNATPRINGSALPVHSSPKKNGCKKPSVTSSQSLTPAPSSDAVEEMEVEVDVKSMKNNGNHKSIGLPSPITPASAVAISDGAGDAMDPKGFYSPSRKVRDLCPFAEFATDCRAGKEAR